MLTMRDKCIFLFCLVLCLSLAAFAAPATMRLDYYHTGDATHELFSVDRIVIEPLPWHGDMTKTVNDTTLGNLFFEVLDQASGRVPFSRGFSSVYGEWITTEEAKNASRTFSESLRFPAPDAPVKIVLNRRDEGQFHEIWTTRIDP